MLDLSTGQLGLPVTRYLVCRENVKCLMRQNRLTLPIIFMVITYFCSC
jgi:hypothetical protein